MKNLYRKDNKIVSVTYFDNANNEYVECFVIERLNFENYKNTKDIKKDNIIAEIYKNERMLLLHNKYIKVDANLSKNNIRKMISTIFDKTENNVDYRIQKELISNIASIFYNAIPICTHPELKNEKLFDKQVIYRFALPVKILLEDYFIMITAKGKEENINITNISIYDFKTKKALDRKPYTPTRCTHSQEHTYMLNDLTEFVNSNLEKYCKQ